MRYANNHELPVRTLLAVALLTGVLACGEEPLGPEDVDLSGEWSGLTQNIGLRLSLQEDSDGNLSGEGMLTGTQDSFPLSVSSGNHAGSRFRMVLVFPDVPDDVCFEGSVSVIQMDENDTENPRVELEGALSGSGFREFPMTLTR